MVPQGRYRHYTGAIYVVTNNATHKDTNEKLVIYHEEERPEAIWALPEKEWRKPLSDIGGRSIPRFQRLVGW